MQEIKETDGIVGAMKFSLPMPEKKEVIKYQQTTEA